MNLTKVTQPGVHPLVALIVFAIVYFADVWLFPILPANSWMFVAGLTFVLYVAAPLIVTLICRIPVVDGIWLGRLVAPRLATWLVLATALLVPAYICLNLLLAKYNLDVRRMIQGDLREMRRIMRMTPWPLALAGGLGFAFAEEVMFRGFMLNALRRWGNAAAMLLSSACFALAHHSTGKLIPMMVAGLWFGYAALRTRSIWVSTASHFVVNGLLLVAAMQHGGARISLPQLSDWWVAVIAGGIGLVVYFTERYARRAASTPAISD